MLPDPTTEKTMTTTPPAISNPSSSSTSLSSRPKLTSSDSPSTPDSSLVISRSSGSPRPPTTDTRSHYKGFAFVFATDAYHERRNEFGRELGTSIKYLKPTVADHEEAIDPLAAVHLPWFFTGFKWKDVNGQERTMSRGALCSAWQVAFNRLLYYASFQEGNMDITGADVEWSKEEFVRWNDLFCELDTTIGKLSECEQAHIVPHFQPSVRLANLAVFGKQKPTPALSQEETMRNLTSTFLCAAIEIIEMNRQQRDRRKEDIRPIELGIGDWEPCTGYSVVESTAWNRDRGGGGLDGEEAEQGTVSSTAVFDRVSSLSQGL